MAYYGTRLPTSTVLAAVDWKPDDSFGAMLRQHVGEVSEDAGAALIVALKRYVSECEFDQNAGLLSDARKRLEQIRSAAERFWQLLQTDANTDNPEPLRYVESLLNEYTGPRGFTATGLINIMTELVIACDKAQNALNVDVASSGDYAPGRSWAETFVWGLANFWSELGKAPTARKDSSSQRRQRKESAFVLFAWDVQCCLPVSCRRSTHSYDAFALAVSKALSEWRGVNKRLRV